MKLLICGETVLAAEPFVETPSEIRAAEAIFPKAAMPGWTFIETPAPADINPFLYRWTGSQLQRRSPPPPAPPSSISRLQLILGMTSAGLITPAEGVSAAAGSAIPAVVEAVFASLPAAEATSARIRWSAMTEVERANPLVAAVAAAAGKSPSEMDDFFRDWSRL